MPCHFSSANRWRGLSAPHTSRHRQDPINQAGARPEDLQLHPHAEERRRRVRPNYEESLLFLSHPFHFLHSVLALS